MLQNVDAIFDKPAFVQQTVARRLPDTGADLLMQSRKESTRHRLTQATSGRPARQGASGFLLDSVPEP